MKTLLEWVWSGNAPFPTKDKDGEQVFRFPVLTRLIRRVFYALDKVINRWPTARWKEQSNEN